VGVCKQWVWQQWSLIYTLGGTVLFLEKGPTFYGGIWKIAWVGVKRMLIFWVKVQTGLRMRYARGHGTESEIGPRIGCDVELTS
jgi:hypothetical protein